MSILNAIKRTVKYSQRFGGQLTKDQLFKRLIGNKVYTRKEISNFQFPISNKKNKYLKEKIKKAEELANKISKNFEDILFLGITGSVAADYPKKNDDVDIIIITKVNKLWITRLKLRFFIMINKIPHRKFGKKEKKDDFCFNLWLDEKTLKIKKGRQNLRNAMDLILIKPLINKNKIYERFIFTNDWAKKWVATGYSELVNRSSMIDSRKNKDIFLDRIVNWLVFWPQFWYMKKKVKNEKIGLNEAFFHH